MKGGLLFGLLGAIALLFGAEDDDDDASAGTGAGGREKSEDEKQAEAEAAAEAAKTPVELIKATQREINRVTGAGLTVDGKVGPKSCAAALQAAGLGREDLHPSNVGWDCSTPKGGAIACGLPPGASGVFIDMCKQALNSGDPSLMRAVADEFEANGFNLAAGTLRTEALAREKG